MSSLIFWNASKCLRVNSIRYLSTHKTDDLVLIDVNDKTGYAILSLNRSPVNSFNLDLLHAFDHALGILEKNKPRGMILTSNISKIFSVGFDIRELYNPDPQRIREFWRKSQDCWLKLYGSSYPTAAAINGHNPAAGCFFSMACEYRVMVPHSKIGLSGARLGILMPLPIIQTMKSILSSRQTENAILTGTLFTSEEALKVGLIDEIAKDKDDAILKCEEYLNRFKKIPPIARGKTKELIRKADLDAIMNNREKDIEDFVASICSSEAQNAFEKFIETSKRKKSE